MDPVNKPAEAEEQPQKTEQFAETLKTQEPEAPSSQVDADKGFPDHTAVADMAPEQQVAYWKYQSRKHEDTAKANLAKANAEIEKLKQAQMTDSEKAIAEAKTLGAQEARSEMAKANVNVFISARVADQEAADLIRESINHAAFVSEDGSIDDKKLGAYLNKVAGTSQVHRDPHQGLKQKPGAPSAAEKGRAEAARRFKKTTD